MLEYSEKNKLPFFILFLASAYVGANPNNPSLFGMLLYSFYGGVFVYTVLCEIHYSLNKNK